MQVSTRVGVVQAIVSSASNSSIQIIGDTIEACNRGVTYLSLDHLIHLCSLFVLNRIAVMAFTFDTLSFARYLREKGVPSQQTEAHADAVRQFVKSELVTKQDLALALDNATLKLTVRLGAMLAAGVALLGAILKLA